ncbi:MAG: tRNA dihydrouridine synthase DusB [Candidatus Omnitrophota bacterium]
MIKIGSLQLKSNLILAPMAGITDLPYRMLNREFGADLCFTEMINCRCLGGKNRKTRQMLMGAVTDRPLGIQILGSEEKYISRAMDVMRDYEFDILDFNAACPEKKVVNRGEGAGLLKNLEKLKRILELVVKNSWVPVTAKIRIGWDKDSTNSREIALICQDAGVKALFIHGRTRMQFLKGDVDYGQIRDMKKALSIPVIGSGDVLTEDSAQRMFQETGCDGILVARGSLGNPWIFRQLDSFLGQGIKLPRPSPREISLVMSRHLQSCVDFYGEKTGIVIFRKFFAWYTWGRRNTRNLRQKASTAKTLSEVLLLIKEFGGRGC